MIRNVVIAACLGLLALPAAAQTQPRWSVPAGTLEVINPVPSCSFVARGEMRGQSIFLTLINPPDRMLNLRLDVVVELSNATQRKSQPATGIALARGQQRDVEVMTPFGGSLAGTKLTVTVTNCLRSSQSAF